MNTAPYNQVYTQRKDGERETHHIEESTNLLLLITQKHSINSITHCGSPIAISQPGHANKTHLSTSLSTLQQLRIVRFLSPINKKRVV